MDLNDVGDAVKTLNNEILKALEYREEELINKSEWGSITFKNAQTDLDQIFDILTTLSVLPIEQLPDSVLAAITKSVVPIAKSLESIQTYSIEQTNHTQIRDTLISQVNTQLDNLLKNAAQWIPFLAYQKGDISLNIEKLSKSVEDAKILYTDGKKDLNAKKEDVDKIVVAAREASASAGAAVFTADFLNEAKTLKEDVAKPWIIATTILAGCTLLAALFLWFWPADAGLDNGQIIQKIGTKIFILASLFTATLWSGRMYKSTLHQAATYRHRGLSIKTLEAFHHSAADPAAKDAVVLEAARAVYGSTPTGLINEGGAGSDPATRVIEISKSFTSTK
jgi:archaellum component FlaC